MRRLIVNADDYGRSSNISRGIRDAHLGGIVTSTTCMMNFPTTAEDIRTALQLAPRLGLGTHLVLTSGTPLTPANEIPSLVASNGAFRNLDSVAERSADLDPAEAKLEWRAQIAAFISAAGRNPSHLDSHHHVSYMNAGLLRTMLELAADYGCAIRVPKGFGTDEVMEGLPASVRASINRHAPSLIEEFGPPHPDAVITSFYDGQANKAHLLDVLNSLPDGTYELMCHAGYTDTDATRRSVYNAQRERELTILADPDVLKATRQRDIQLITFDDL